MQKSLVFVVGLIVGAVIVLSIPLVFANNEDSTILARLFRLESQIDVKQQSKLLERLQKLEEDVRLLNGERIIAISIPPNSQNNPCYPKTDNVYDKRYPVTEEGIGWIVSKRINFKPDNSNFVLHDNQLYTAPHSPDPQRAVVTYEFDNPMLVNELEVIQHINGITQIEGFVGDTRDSLRSIGRFNLSISETRSDGRFVEGGISVFSFPNETHAKFFKFVISQTIHPEAYAIYRAYPRIYGKRYYAKP